MTTDDAEPDQLAWRDVATGLDCYILRHPRLRSLNGYVRVPEGHPLYGVDYDAVYDLGHHIEVHGGLTFAGPMGGFSGTYQEGPRGGWWFGFDCTHAWDLVPGYAHMGLGLGSLLPEGEMRETYRDIAYVREQCVLLALQLAAIRALGAQ